MKKKILLFLSVIVLTSAFSMVSAKPSTELTEAIQLYKSQNYTECYAKLTELVKSDPSDALVYYYMAMSATQLGKREEAIDFYNKTLSLVPVTSNLGRYATKGKLCIENETACQKANSVMTIADGIMNNNSTELSSPEVKSEFEKLKIENLMREMNRNNDIPAQRFKEYKDFSSYNSTETPTNDEIVAAMRTLQRAGLSNIGNNYSDLSLLTGNHNNDIANMFGGNINPQIMQAMFTNNMSLGF